MAYSYKRKKKNSAYRKKVRKTQRGGAPLALLATRFGPQAAKLALKNPGLAKKALSMGMSKGMGKGMGKNLTGLMNNPQLKSIVNNVISSLAAPAPAAPSPAPAAPAPVNPEQEPTENKEKGGSKRKTKRSGGGGTCSYANGGAKKSKRKTKRNKRTRRTRRNSRK